ncbi:MAG TPA: hypothetical protein VGR79_04420 [Stellaceae bacterium]|nr:hypothetical protein [Stellaceae bacterium]
MSRGWHRFRILAAAAGIGLGLFGVQPATAQYDPTYPAPACPAGYYYWPGYGCIVYPPNGYYYYPPPIYYAPPPVAVYPAPAFAFFDVRFGRPFFFHHGGGFHRH